jgi:ribosome-binding protein aMBF1 (putative translation factor)
MEPTDIPRRIRAALARKGENQKWLAVQIHVSENTLSRRMHHPSGWTVVELAAAARALDVPLSWLAGDNGAVA